MNKAIDLIKSLSTEAKQLPEVIAPILGTNGMVDVIIGTHPYRFDIETDVAGWYILKPESSTRASIVREASVSEVRKCLNACPQFTTIAVRRLHQETWLVFAFNLSDASSRDLETVNKCFLIDKKIEPFTILRTRIWGSNLLFDPTRLVSPPKKYIESLEKGEDKPPKVKGLNPEFGMVYSMLNAEIQKAKATTIEGRIKNAIKYLGGEFVGFTESGDDYMVSWKDEDQTYKSRISRNMRLVSAGICLSGLEHQQTLASTVAVMRRSEHRYDYEDDYDD
jgi:hypothetical protein